MKGISDEAWWEHFAPDADGYFSNEWTRPFIEVERRATTYIYKQDSNKQRSLTHTDIIKISEELGYELSYEQRLGVLQRIKAEQIFMPAMWAVYKDEAYIEINDIRIFIEKNDWPVILPPETSKDAESDERSRQLVNALKENGWNEEASKNAWARRREVSREESRKAWSRK